MKDKVFTNRAVVAVMALLCCALWGSATPFIKIGYEFILPVKNTASTMLFAGARFTLAGIITIIIYSASRRRFLFPKKENLLKVVNVAAVQTVIQYIFYYIGLANTTGVKGTIASGSSAFFSVIIAGYLFRLEKVTFKKILACIIGFAGIIIININGLDFNMNFTGDCFVIFSAVSLAISSVLTKRYSKFEDPVVISGYQFVLGGVILIIIGAAFGGKIVIDSAAAVGIIIYLAFLSAIAYSLWGVLLKFNPVSRVTIYSFMTPVFGVILSSVMLSEEATVSPLSLMIALILVSAGVIMLNYKKEG